MQLFRFLFQTSRWLLVLSVFTGAAAGIGSAYILAMVNASVHHVGQLQPAHGFAFVAAVLLVVGAELVSRLVLLRMSSSAVKRMRLSLCERILHAPLRLLEQRGTSGLMAALTDDIHRIAEALMALPAQCVNLAIAGACFVYLYWMSWELATGYLVIYSVGILGHLLVMRLARPSIVKGRQYWDTLIALYESVIHGNKELKLHRPRRNAVTVEELVPAADRMMRNAWTANWITASGTSFTQLIFFALIGLVLYVAPAYSSFAPEVLTAFLLMALFVSSPIAAIVGAMPKFQKADIALKQIESLGLSLDASGASDLQAELRDARVATHRFERIELRGVSYVYEPDQPGESPFTVGPVDLTVQPGQLLFVIGGNGSGKSSFIRILTGLYPPTEGTLDFNGVEITDENRDDYRQNFSAVFSDYHLFRSLKGLAVDSLDEAAGGYLDKLDLMGKVKVKHGLLSTVNLSQGQRKRLALLSAFIEDRNIYIFDEWAADQDPSFKRVFYYEILPELKARGKTVIVVSHDDHYFDVADRVIRFEEGRLVSDRRGPSAVEVPSLRVPA